MMYAVVPCMHTYNSVQLMNRRRGANTNCYRKIDALEIMPILQTLHYRDTNDHVPIDRDNKNCLRKLNEIVRICLHYIAVKIILFC